MMKSRKYYHKIRTIGNGGHGYVDEVRNEQGQFFARKKLTHLREGKAYARFKAEIEVLLQLVGISGIVEIVDFYFPASFSKSDAPYYIMPIGVPFPDYIKGKSPEVMFKHFISICEALEKLHARDITHRDLKPSNLLVIDNQAVIADFGLANFPDKAPISDLDEAIGAKWTIAPEMERARTAEDYKKADVYSLAKTLWILITGNVKAFEGQYIPRSSISIDNYIDLRVNAISNADQWYYFSIVLLEKLLADSTSNDPNRRPTITEFKERLQYWLVSNSDYFQRNPYEWEDALRRIFPIGIPSHSQWTQPDDIYRVLSILTEYDNLNHCFLPPRGGLDMTEVKWAHEPGCLIVAGDIVKPSTLYFDMLDVPGWSYFKLEFAPLAPIHAGEYGETEHLHMLDSGEYVSEDEPSAVPVDRHRKGSLVVTAKTSPINGTGHMDGYLGIHVHMPAATYRKAWELEKAGEHNVLLNLIAPFIPEFKV